MTLRSHGGPLRTALALAELAVRPAGLLADEVPAQQRALDATDHRPWEPPRRPWLMGQTWRELLFAHWPVPVDALRPVVPRQLPIDTYDGAAWLGITPFLVTGLRLHGAPPLPGAGWFRELNVRTYVVVGGRPGIFFFSLDASSALAVAVARRAYLLPYFRASASIQRLGATVAYRSERRSGDGAPARFEARYRPVDGPPVGDDPLARWLAERYCLYVVDGRERVLRGEIHHRPWPLEHATAEIAVNTMARPLGLQLSGEPLLHFSRRQDTVIWALARADEGASAGRPARLRS